MPVWSQGSAHPTCGATSECVSDHEFDTDASASGSRWVELYRLLLAPAAEGYALRPIPGGVPVREASGDPADLISQAEHAGGGRAVWAIVAPLRPDLVVVDVDRCADRVLTSILDSIDDAAAQLAYLAASGSPDSVHIAIACPSRASRDYLIERITTIRTWECLSPTELDLRTRDQFLRLPGSAPLKPGGSWCYPIDEGGNRITVTAAIMRADRAIRELPAVLVPVSGRSTGGRRSRTLGTVAQPAPLRRYDNVDDSNDATLDGDLDQPRAWRPQRPFTSAEWATLHRTATEGYRSHAATAGAWVLWRHGIRGWRRAAGWYRSCPAFEKFASRDDGGRAHWESIKSRATTYRPADPAADDLIRTVLTEIATWDDPALVAAAYACVTKRFADGHGTDSRPIAWRDMALWLNVSHDTAGRRLRALVDRGLLRVTLPHDRSTSPHSATCYSLQRPAEIYRTDVRHDVTNEGITRHPILHALWGELGHPCWSVWTHLPASGAGASTSTLSTLTGLPAGTLSHGVRRLLAVLEKLGLAIRQGQGRGTRWLRGPQTLAAAADASGATEICTERSRVITAEREAWHAPTVRRSLVIRERLRRRTRRSPTPSSPTRAFEAAGGHPELPFAAAFSHRAARVRGHSRTARSGPGRQPP